MKSVLHGIEWFFQQIVFAEIVFKKTYNGGMAVFFRTIITGIIVSLFVLIAFCVLWEYPIAINKPESIDWLYVARCNLLEDWWKYCGIYAAVYTSYYARFVSQWTYLSNLYNQIKETDVNYCLNSDCDNAVAKEKLDGWKAGFIEDAENLHMETKPLFAAVIYTWLKTNSNVGEIYKKSHAKLMFNQQNADYKLQCLKRRIELVLKKEKK